MSPVRHRSTLFASFRDSVPVLVLCSALAGLAVNAPAAVSTTAGDTGKAVLNLQEKEWRLDGSLKSIEWITNDDRITGARVEFSAVGATSRAAPPASRPRRA
jgi:hypothetical protein